jgi:hypothetical protein
MKTPLLCIRVRHSECPALHPGQQFDTIADFEATLGAIRRASASAGQSVSFVLTWRDRATFHGRLTLDAHRPEGLVEHMTRVCREVLAEARLEVLVAGAQLTIMRLFEAVVAERVAGRTRTHLDDERSCSRSSSHSGHRQVLTT